MRYYWFLAFVLLLALSASAGAKIKATRYTLDLQGNSKIEGLYDDWWQNAVIYQVYPRSFKDSDNDGSGDLQGIIDKMDHFVNTGINAFWLSPIYKSPQVDNGYDIMDYRDIDPLYGTLEDLRKLVDEAHKRNLKVILDYVPNHTSDQHAWFLNSVNRTAPYDDYYIWKNATYVNGTRTPPNNWLSAFYGSAWEWNEQRQQYYYHMFAAQQPDLNYRNPNVVNDMKDVLRYWLNFGIDGFRMDAVNTLFEDILLRDEPPSGNSGISPDDPVTLDHIYTINQNETIDMIYQFREVLDEFSAQNKSYNRIMMTEVYATPNISMRYYINEDHTRRGAHFSFNFWTFILTLNKDFNAFQLAESIQSWQAELPIGCTSNWVLGNHDQRRVSTRLGVENIDALNMLIGILPGVQITYQGEEIGAEDGEVTCEEGYDPQAIKNCSTYNITTRDFERTPYQWDNSTNAGFNEGHKTWLPVSEKYHKTNLAAESLSGLKSHYNVYKQIVEIKQEFKNTTRDMLSFGSHPNNVFYCERKTDSAHYALVFNAGNTEQPVYDFLDVNSTLEVVISNVNSQYKKGDSFEILGNLQAKESLLLKVTPLEE
ncbi:maltase 2-like [Anthonomus grandis grandis]|uniref:maltase 2-like n=1 Tax=Anthonomus grandis grandis TaxID=2921223 RepID=UPI002165A05D|nr:maltase 2-like [Anthonomus grandis grandis]